jgi:ketosteroid isomerase-like protein
VLRIARVFIAVALALCAGSLYAQMSADEQEVWKQEHAYWKYVQSADLENYRSLWNAKFVGWPMSSAKPARKNQITDWITAYTAKGRHLQSFELKQADSQTHGNIVLTYYWITTNWADKNGKQERQTDRITHTWMRVRDQWQIIGGMSCLDPQPGH